jgi:hypothetical protein
MDTTCVTPVTELRRGALMRLEGGAGRAVAVFDGHLWITQSGDSRDVFLRRGERFSFGGSGTIVLEALSDARVTVFPTDRAAGASVGRRAATLLSAAVAVLSGVFLVLGSHADASAVIAAAPAEAAIAR